MKREHKSIVLGFSVLVILVGFFLYFQKEEEIKKQAKNFLGDLSFEAIIEGIRQEVNNPGALIAKIESERANLTKAGILNFTNAERARFDLYLLEPNSKLDIVAKVRLNDMFQKQYFEHISPTGDSASEQAKIAGYDYISIGENIALGNFEDDETLVAAWMASLGHRENILSSKFSEIGIAAQKGIYKGKSTWLAVQIFARPKSECPAVDFSLKVKIESEKMQISELESQLKELEKELEDIKDDQSRRRDYNHKVSEYNILVKQINDLISVLKSDISNYNNQVKSYNNCIER